MSLERILGASLLLIAIAGCGGVPLDKQTVSIQDDQFSQNAAIIGTRLFDNPNGGPFKEWFIRSYVNKIDGSVKHDLYVNTHYLGHWHFYQSASDDAATGLPLISINQAVEDCQGLCAFDETFALLLSEPILHARAESGFKVKVSAKDGTAFILSVLPGQIKPQLAAIDNYKTSHGKTQTQSANEAAPAPHVLGLGAVPMPPPIASLLKLSGGLYVAWVTPGSVADRAGIKAGDVILSYADKPVTAPAELQAAIAATPTGTSVRILTQRGMAQIPVQIMF